MLAQPDTRELAETPSGDLLDRYWRLLFYLRVHSAFDDKLTAGELPAAGVRGRIERIGRVAFDEARSVLGQEEMLLPPETEASAYVEFAATYLELRYFAPSFVPRYFPGLESLAVVDAVVAEDVDAGALFCAAQPRGAG